MGLRTDTDRPCKDLEELAYRIAAGVTVRIMNHVPYELNYIVEVEARKEILVCLKQWVKHEGGA